MVAGSAAPGVSTCTTKEESRGKIHGVFRHDRIAVEVGAEINHRDQLPGAIMPDMS